MDENKRIVVNLINQLMNDSQLSDEEQLLIKNMMLDRQKKREDDQKGRCLAEAIDLEMSRILAPEDINMNNACYSVYEKYIKNSRLGKLDCSKLSESKIKKFEKNVRELYGLNEKEIVIFRELFQLGLNRMAKEGLLNFDPYLEMSDDFSGFKYRTSYIENPYSEEETAKIMQWSEYHSADIRGLAVSLWFTGGISLTQIVNLTRKDCWGNTRKSRNSIMEFEERMFYTDQRMRILRKAIDQRLRDMKYVFVVPRKDGSGWKKMTEKGLKMKLWHICKNIGIEYKGIHNDQAIKLNT